MVEEVEEVEEAEEVEGVEEVERVEGVEGWKGEGGRGGATGADFDGGEGAGREVVAWRALYHAPAQGARARARERIAGTGRAW